MLWCCDEAEDFAVEAQEKASSPSSQVHFTKKEPCVFKAKPVAKTVWPVAKIVIIVTMKKLKKLKEMIN